jgi:hypothetical protein
MSFGVGYDGAFPWERPYWPDPMAETPKLEHFWRTAPASWTCTGQAIRDVFRLVNRFIATNFALDTWSCKMGCIDVRSHLKPGHFP